MKAILVLNDMPKNCGDCPCVCEELAFCQADEKNKDCDWYKTPSWCPLKPMPEKVVVDMSESHEAYYQTDPQSRIIPNKWIPVSERLPENHNQEVLISLKWGIDIGWYSDGEWHSEWINHYDDGNVLAWMPLPKPYVEETAKQGETE